VLVVEALARIQELAWSASLVGSDEADPEYAGLVRAAVAAHGLEQRVRITGELKGQALEDEWRTADLSVLVSRAEAFGMVVTESLAHGIPVAVRAGTGAVEALSFATPDKRQQRNGCREWQCILPELMTRKTPSCWLECCGTGCRDAGTRDTWRAAALETRNRLPGWDQAAELVLGAVSKTAGSKGATQE
jgi:hypothetical protein